MKIAFTPPYLKAAVRIGLFLTMLIALSACNGAQEATIVGKVELEGRLLKSGTVTFISEDGKSYSAAISAEGVYKIERVPPGEFNIKVNSHARNPFGKFEGPNSKNDPKAAETILEIPEKYNDAKKSGLKCDVKQGPGPHSHDIHLEKR